MSFAPITSNGFTAGVGYTSLLSGGMPITALPPPLRPGSAPFTPAQVISASADVNLDPALLASLKYQSTVLDANGNSVQPSPFNAIDLGQGRVLEFDQGSLDARMRPVLDPTAGSGITVYSDSEAAFSGSSCRILIEFPHTPVMNGGKVTGYLGKQLLEATAITISTHRAKTQVRPFGYINPKGIARGSRTIAGTLILNKFTTEVLYRFLQAGLMADISKDTTYNKLDQLPPLTMTLLFSNEQGYVSKQALFGVEFITDGNVIGVQDILLEQTLTYFATDMSPLTPLNFSTLFNPSTTPTAATAGQKTVSGLWVTS